MRRSPEMKTLLLTILCAGAALVLAACSPPGEESPAETLSSAETSDSPEQDENPLLGAWQYDEDGRPEVILFGAQQNMEMLRYRDKVVLEPYMTFENGEMRYVLAPELLTDITRDEDVADFRIYEMELEKVTDYYILDKNGEVFYLRPGMTDCTYTLTPDSLILTYNSQDGEQTALAVEFADSDTIHLTGQEDGEETTLTLTRADHLYAVMNYLN